MSRCHLCREEDDHQPWCPYGEKVRYPRRFRIRFVPTTENRFVYGVYFPSTDSYVTDILNTERNPGKPVETMIEWIDKEPTE